MPRLNVAQSAWRCAGKFAGRARNRAGAPIYGRMVHKAPAGSRLRNGMRQSLRPLDKIPRFYGTINSYPPSPRRRITSFRSMGGGSPPLSQVPQAGSFDHLKELLHAERARELQVNRQLIECELYFSFRSSFSHRLNSELFACKASV